MEYLIGLCFSAFHNAFHLANSSFCYIKMAEPVEPGRDQGEEQAQGAAQEAQGCPLLPPHHTRARATVRNSTSAQIGGMEV